MGETGSDRKRILIVEDDHTLLQMMATALRRAGYDVIESQDGLDGDTKTRSFKPDLIIHDLMVPGKSGIDVLKDLKNDPLHRHIPVILITVLTEDSHHSDEYWRQQTGAADFITKPFTVADLVWRVAKTLAAKSAPGQEVHTP